MAIKTLLIVIFASVFVVFYLNQFFAKKREKRLEQMREKKEQQFQDLLERIKSKSD